MLLQVSQNGRFLVLSDGTPFFYLGDTAWELFHRLNREEADFYLQTRAAQGFTVIQAVVLAEYGGLTVPNTEGGLPLHDNDPMQPHKVYFRHMDWIVNRAAELGLFIGILPTWGDKVNQKWGEGPEIFTSDNAYPFSKFLGRRYGDKPIIWILGGDRVPESETHSEIWRNMVKGLHAGDDGRNLMTFHPMGGHSSSAYFHDDAWLDFNMMQTGHRRNSPNYENIAADYARLPIKPCLDGEPGYEDHPENFNAENGYLNDYDVRKSAYWVIFAGACGHTYGCHDVWQFLDESRFPAVTCARTPWREALQLPGANQMQHVRALIKSRPFLTRIPDQSLLLSDPGVGTEHVQATRAADGSYAFVYSPSGQPFTLDLSKLSGETLNVWWYDPRTGQASSAGQLARTAAQIFTPPSQGSEQDWILVLDDLAQDYLPPGQERWAGTISL